MNCTFNISLFFCSKNWEYKKNNYNKYCCFKIRFWKFPCIISKIIRNLEGLGENEIPTATIGKFIMDGLSNLDQVAYVRFASVYRNFKEAKDFEQFIGNLNEYKSE